MAWSRLPSVPAITFSSRRSMNRPELTAMPSPADRMNVSVMVISAWRGWPVRSVPVPGGSTSPGWTTMAAEPGESLAMVMVQSVSSRPPPRRRRRPPGGRWEGPRGPVREARCPVP